MNVESVFEHMIACVVVGMVATAFMDLWAIFLKHVFGVRPLNYALVGRLGLHAIKGEFFHKNINVSQEMTGELMLGWLLHYLIGVIFSAVFIGLVDELWFYEPSIYLSILFGLLTVLLPFLIMQPAMGLGIAAAKAPLPNVARIRSIQTHCIFGVGLYLGGLVYSFLF
ncbi:hypothetical protein PCIT_a2846 [Pseudoalteromonas citrea]|uniref:DUF2938 domain-containing protein n=2 Tax=Pseudoalteromonas citrea TaxID=43655 RepID=A0AAD4AHS4_9GAMM|nr:DUF2938 domain-containing protein [Pseudoalteromonas citrea]KAF7769921.1 hypothetical protein PCIT_a2846 [Pseudoalteromonas citrea]